MVDVGEKPITPRSAAAEANIRVSPELAACIRANTLKKGDLFSTARLAGILAAKKTPELIPLCHSLPLDAVDITIELHDHTVHIRAEARTHSRTGVEMEALTAAAIAALTVIDMGKAVDKHMVIEGLRVTEKHGGRSGSWSFKPESSEP